jgi:hypothetical protein
MNQYYYRNTTVFGFHGCRNDIKQDLLTGRKKFNISTKSYDWLGSGALPRQRISRTRPYTPMRSESRFIDRVVRP